jgi:hypothetical protein
MLEASDADLGSGRADGGTVAVNVPERPAKSPAGNAATGPPNRRHHWVRTSLLIAGSLVIVIVAVAVGSYIFRDPPGPKSLGASTRQFKATTTTAPTVGRLALPAAGVYEATGQGAERITRPPDSQRDGPVMPITVSYRSNGCWLWRIDYNTASWHEYEFCPHGTELLLVAQSNYQSWNFGLVSITNLARYKCDPPSPILVQSPKPGETFTQRCTGTNTAVPGPSVAAGTVTVVGVKTVLIGKTPVRAVEMTRSQTISGAQYGVLDESWWFATSTGLPIKAERDYKLVTSSAIGKITYTESGSWQLNSLTPRS